VLNYSVECSSKSVPHTSSQDLRVHTLGLLVVIIAVFLLQAALVKAVQDVRDGRVDLSVGATFSAALPLVGSVAVAAILAGIAITIGLLIVIIPGLFLITIWCLIVPVIVLEGVGALDSFGRSLQLVRNSFWNVSAHSS
jgi:hypothetical protein